MPVTVSVQNFGPIREAEVELKPLIVLVGTNNTGKTYFATVLQRVLEAHTGSWRTRQVLAWQFAQIIEGMAPHRGSRPPEGERATASAPPSPDVIEVTREFLSHVLLSFGMSLHEEIEYAFGVPPSDLSRRTSSGKRARGPASISVRQSSPPAWSVTVDTTSGECETSPPDEAEWLAQLRRSLLDSDGFAAEPGFLVLPQAAEVLNREGIPGLFDGWPDSSVHLPANRTGIIQSYQVIASSFVERSVRARTRPRDVPTLPGTAADFLSLLLAITQPHPAPPQGERSAIVDLVDAFEREIGLQVVVDADNGLPGISVVTPEGRFPLGQTSSMVSELAPILLAARHVLAPNGCLVVDEPEAHLHPALQKLTAQFFGALTNRGVRSVLTTHSDFFLGELNNLIRSYAVDRARRPVSAGGVGEAIDPGDVAALRFDRTRTGCVATQLPVDPIDGIDESTFGDVIEALYGESIALTDALNAACSASSR